LKNVKSLFASVLQVVPGRQDGLECLVLWAGLGLLGYQDPVDLQAIPEQLGLLVSLDPPDQLDSPALPVFALVMSYR